MEETSEGATADIRVRDDGSVDLGPAGEVELCEVAGYGHLYQCPQD